MFTGIIEEIGSLVLVAEKEDIHVYAIQASTIFVSEIKEGDSVAVNGVCLTAYNIQNDSFNVDVSTETQKCSNLHGIENKTMVNLERAVTPSTRLGCLLYTSPSPRDQRGSRMPSSA